jgi:chemotaxis protein histidine kinase CheA
MTEFEKEVKLDFLTEANQLLNDAEQAFLALEGDKNNTNLMNEIFRLAHNLKGTSRAVGFGDVAKFTHEMENLILQLKEGRLEITDTIVSLLLDCNDHVSVMIKTLNHDLDATFDSTEIIAKIQKALNGELESTVSDEPVKVKKEKSNSLSKEHLELLENFQSNQMVNQIRECGHIFCITEIQEWFQNNVHCPVCRYDIRNYQSSPDTPINNITTNNNNRTRNRTRNRIRNTDSIFNEVLTQFLNSYLDPSYNIDTSNNLLNYHTI